MDELGPRSLALIVALHVAVDLVGGSVVAVLPWIQQRRGLSDVALTGVTAAFLITSSVAQPLAGRLADRHGAHAVTTLGAVGATLLLGPLVLAPSVGTLYALVVGGGLMLAGFHPAASVVARRPGPTRPELAVGVFAAGGAVGAALGPPIAIAGLARGPLVTVLAVGVPALAVGVIATRLLPRPAPAPAGRARGRMTWTPTLVHLTIAGTLTATAGIAFTAGFPRWAVGGGLEPADAAIGWTLALFSGAGAVSGIAASWLWHDRRPSRLMAVSVGAAMLPLLATLALRPGSLPSMVAVTAAGLLLGAGVPATVTMTRELAPGNVATATGVLLGLTGGLAGAAYLLVGTLATVTGTGPALALTFLGLLPAGALTAATLACGPGGLWRRLTSRTACTCPLPRRRLVLAA